MFEPSDVSTIASMALDRYATAHASPQGAGDSRPTAAEVLEDRFASPSELQAWGCGKTIIITGGTSGIGLETARVLHKTGARIFITGRDRAKGEAVAAEISAPNPHFTPIEMIAVDQSDQSDVRRSAENFLRRSGGKLNILIANAGVMGCPQTTTVDGFEKHFAVNHLAHFHLFHLLRPALEASATDDFHSRVVMVSSAGHRMGGVNPEDYHMQGEEYSFAKAYAQSKTANIYMANEIERRYGATCKVHGLSLNPGLILATDIGRDFPGSAEERRQNYLKSDQVLANWEKSVEQGAATQVWASVAKELEGQGALYLDDVQVAKEAGESDPPWLPGWKAHIWDHEMAAIVWKDSLVMLGWPADQDDSR